VGDAVGGAVRDAFDTISQLWWNRWPGRHWTAWWGAYWGFFRDVCNLHLDGDTWDKSRAWDDANSAGWWWPFHDFVMVCDLPTVLHLEQVGPTGWGSHRLHCETGPAIAWADGWGLYMWHGVQVPAELIETGWSTDRILQEPNAEVRRCAIERMGWDQFIREANLKQVGSAVPDPGNPGNELALYDVPARIYDEPVRVLLCTNGTVERDGTRRRFGLTVPASIDTPVAAAAWGYGLTADQYATAQRRA